MHIADQIGTVSALEKSKQSHRGLELERTVGIARWLPSLTLEFALQFHMYVFVCLFVSMLNVPVNSNSYGNIGTVSSLGKLD